MSSIIKESQSGETGDAERRDDGNDSSSETSEPQSQSSDTDSDGDARDIQSADMRWNQMKRIAQKKRQHHGEKDRLKGLMSVENIKRVHGLKRMKEGLEALLHFHSPVELSSICGCLRIKVQQKAAMSMSLIIRYACEEEQINEQRLRNILRFAYEGAMWEYLQSLGHPIHSMLNDPRDTIIQIWREGGLLGNEFSFVPHFVRREVKRRSEWNASPDIQQWMDKIVVAQEKAKETERKVISEHDYTNILQYFQSVAQLRNLEAQARDYLISELEVARSHLDSNHEQIKTYRAQTKEAELQLLRISERLNSELAHSEFVAKQAARRLCEVTSELQRLKGVLDSYLVAERSRSEVGGGVLAGSKLRQPDACHPLIHSLHSALVEYKDMRDDRDDDVRQRARCHIHEINQLRSTNATLEEELVTIHEYKRRQHLFADHLLRDFVLTSRALERERDVAQHKLRLLGEVVNRKASALGRLEVALRRSKPMLLAATRSSQAAMRSLGLLLLRQLYMIQPGDEERCVLENMDMAVEDVGGGLARVAWQAERESLKAMQEQQERELAAKRAKKNGRAGGGARNGGGRSPAKAAAVKPMPSTASSGSASPSRGGNRAGPAAAAATNPPSASSPSRARKK